MNEYLLSLEPIKQEIIARLYGLKACNGNKPCNENSELPSYEDLANELSNSTYPEEVFRYASGYQQNALKLTERDIIELEQDALRELARGKRR